MQTRLMHAPPKAPPPVFSEVEYNDDNSCIICYEDMVENNSLRLECGHRFHKTVILFYYYCTSQYNWLFFSFSSVSVLG